MNTSQHHSEASSVGRYYIGKVLSSDADVIALGQIEAVLALAYEQRTANLIAVFGQLLDGETNTFLGERIDGYELAKQIQERLGL